MTPGGLPDWLVAHLSEVGQANPDGIRRAARYSRCGRCGRWVLRGLDGDVAAMPIVADPHEIDRHGEMVAILLGLRTFMLTRGKSGKGSAWNLDARDEWEIAAGQRTPLVAEHRCGIAVPPATRPWLRRDNRSTNPDGSPPF